MKLNKTLILLVLIFIITLTFRLYFTLQVNGFSSDEAYFNLRYIQSIVQSKSLIFYDTLSYGGREIAQPPLFFLITALFSFGSVILLKIIPEILFSSLVFIIYLITKEITNDDNTALLSSLMSSFIPIFISQSLNTLSVYSLSLPLLFLMLYSILRLEEKKYLWIFIVCSLLLSLTHASAILFIITILIYLFLIAGGAIQPQKIKKEAILFSIILIILIELIIYKKTFLTYGINILWQNLPLNILLDTYKKLTLTQLVIGVGVIPLVLGAIGVYIGLNKEKNKQVYLFSAFVVSILILLVLRFLIMPVGLMILGITLSIFSALTIRKLLDYFKQLKINYLSYIFITLFLVLFLFLSIIPSYKNSKNLYGVAQYKIDDMLWLNHNIPHNSTVLGNIEEGNLITSLGKRLNVIDTNFLLAPNPIERLKDIEIIYTSFSEAKVLELLKKYNINIIYFSDDTKSIYGIQSISYLKGSRCFNDIRGGRIYAVKC